jgi:hypothetical protein
VKPLLLAVVFLGIAVLVLRRTDPERVTWQEDEDGVQPPDPWMDALASWVRLYEPIGEGVTSGEYGRLLAERDRLIGQGADPADLLIPEPPR